MAAKRKLMLLIGAFIGMLIIETGIFCLSMYRENVMLEHGSSVGYEVVGSYGNPTVDDGGTPSVASISLVDDTSSEGMGSFQVSGSFEDGSTYVNGSYRQTFDPNVYELLDDAGNVVGHAHLAYSRPDGSGLLYLSFNGEHVTLNKFSKTPGFVE